MIALINHTIYEQGLFSEVHRRIGNKCIRNYLDCNGLLSNPQILREVSLAFLNAIFTDDFRCLFELDAVAREEFVLVGIANSGTLIASHMASIVGLPMLYYVPPQKELSFSEPEREMEGYLDSLRGKKIILVTGVNVTGAAIKSAIAKFSLDDKEKTKPTCVLGVINRDFLNTITEELNRQGIRSHFLINGYYVEWCSFSDSNPCPYGKKCSIEGDEPHENNPAILHN